MNKGAILLQKDFFTSAQINEIAALTQQDEGEKSNVHESGRYAGLQWHQVDLRQKGYPWLATLYEFLGITEAEMAVFYYLSPAAFLHPHRDLTGASMNNRLRFHVPIITNENVDFRVSHERIRMQPGECWCLDTSYLHSVLNGGDATRVHIVIECNVNDKIRAMLPPRDLRDRVHDIYFISLLASRFLQALLVNSVRNSAYLKAQLRMVWRFIRWRILKLESAS